MLPLYKNTLLAIVTLSASIVVAKTSPNKGVPMTFPAQQISVSVKCLPTKVYDFVSDPKNLPKWAKGLSSSEIKKEGDDWIADSPLGKVKIKFAARNSFGVLDHDVTLPSGEVNYNPLRVVKNSEGSEITFTHFRLPKVTDGEFSKDADTIKEDLTKLKSLLEK